ncbi:MAG: sulfotransferase [Isosphaeraceae bacterium]
MAVDSQRSNLESVASGEIGPAPIWDRPYRSTWMRVLNGVGGAFDKVGVRTDLSPKALMTLAERRAKLSDWGDDRARLGLEALVQSFETQGGAHAFGRLFFRETCVRLLVNRLKIQDDLTRHPEILDVPIRRPLVVTGLPRSGTTLLHRLLSEDPNGRTLLLWETLEPSPPPMAETYRTDPRIERARRSTKTLYSLAPKIPAAHLFESQTPEECNGLFAHVFAAIMLGFMFDVPDYAQWLAKQELVENYAYFKRQLQLLMWKCPGDHWVLKAPAHMFGIDALLEVFPDACIVMTHRDPLQVIPSTCSLGAGFRGIVSDRVDLRRLGAEMAESLSEGTERALAARAAADPARFFDVAYPDLVADPVRAARAACEHFGYPCGDEYEARMRRWMAENPQHKHGVHRYSLDEFGLDPDEVRARFSVYRDWMAANLPASQERN